MAPPVPTEAFSFPKVTPRYLDSPSEAGGETHCGFRPGYGSPVVIKPDAAPHITALRTTSLDGQNWFSQQIDVVKGSNRVLTGIRET